ncbi:MAG: T9SS type A sorting domain-containing protein [Bacteroidetes bacterium]|nr:T9SS type A sorting domain-containing protein [Bacteroidota bacterium]
MEETYPFNAIAVGVGFPFSYIKVLGINSVYINSAVGPVEISSSGLGYFESGNEIVISPTLINTTGFIAHTGSAVLMRISNLSNTCETLSKIAGENNNNFDDNGFNIYPNPANDFITIKINNGDSKTTFKIYNSTMQLIKTLNFESGIENTISTADLPPGIYFIDAQSDNQHWRQKFIINR